MKSINLKGFLKGKRSRIIAISAVALALVVALVWVIVHFAIQAHEDKNFDYTSSKLSKYVEISEDQYKNYSLTLDLAKPHFKNEDGTGVSDTDVLILNIIANEVADNNVDGSAMYTDSTIAVGDEVYFWYRAYIKNADGTELDIASKSNFSSTLEIVTGSLPTTVGGGTSDLIGLESGLVGVNTADYAKFVKITDRAVMDGDVVYVSATRDAGSGEEKGTCVRIDLQDEANSAWVDVLVGKSVGEIEDFNITIGDKNYKYTDTSILFMTACENGESKPTLTVETYAPYDSSIVDIRNETVWVDVYVAGVVKHNPWHSDAEAAPYTLSYDWNNEKIADYIEDKKLNITLDELNAYEGETLVEKYDNYLIEYIWDTYYDVRDYMIEEAMWDHYLKAADIKKYPKNKLDEIYSEYLSDLNYQYEVSGGYIYDASQYSYVTAESLDEYAVIYFELQYKENKDWRSYLQGISESLVAERLILYYIMYEEDLVPTDAEFNAKYVSLRQEYLDEYILQEGTDTSKLTDEEYDEYIAECERVLFGYYDEEYFREQTYYELVLRELLKFPEVITLDESPSLPQDK